MEPLLERGVLGGGVGEGSGEAREGGGVAGPRGGEGSLLRRGGAWFGEVVRGGVEQGGVVGVGVTRGDEGGVLEVLFFCSLLFLRGGGVLGVVVVLFGGLRLGVVLGVRLCGEERSVLTRMKGSTKTLTFSSSFPSASFFPLSFSVSLSSLTSISSSNLLSTILLLTSSLSLSISSTASLSSTPPLLAPASIAAPSSLTLFHILALSAPTFSLIASSSSCLVDWVEVRWVA